MLTGVWLSVSGAAACVCAFADGAFVGVGAFVAMSGTAESALPKSVVNEQVGVLD